MKEAFVNKSFEPKAMDIIRTAESICQNYARQGYDLSLRQLYYQFISRDLFPNTEQSYKRLGQIISEARLCGLIDWDHIKDRGRETQINTHWESPASILYGAAYSFRIDLWDNQPNHVEVMVEKQALEGVLHPVCKRLDVPFTANKGYSSSSLMYEVGKRLFTYGSKDCDLHVIYLGDHDPSGIDMTRDVKERLEQFSGYPVAVHRIALNMDQVRTYDPPENPAKLTDSRAEGYIREFGHSSWELDALEPSLLASLVNDAVLDLRDDDLWDEAVAKQQAWRYELLEMARKYEN